METLVQQLIQKGSGAAAPDWISPLLSHSTCTSCFSKHGWEGSLILGRESWAVILSSAGPLLSWAALSFGP